MNEARQLAPAVAPDLPGAVLPLSLPILADIERSKDLLDQVRWPRERSCARCGSTFTITLNSTVFRGMHRCRDCSYMFNALSGSIFQGTKLPVSKFLQFLVISDFMGRELSLHDVVYAMETTYKTAASLRMKTIDMVPTEPYLVSDKARSEALRAAPDAPVADAANQRFQIFTDANFILIEQAGFERRIREVINWHEIEE